MLHDDDGDANHEQNQDYHRDVEQAAFSPGSLVPGIELSPDSLLQWRAFFYRDAQYWRLQSANIHQIPVNCPFMARYVFSFRQVCSSLLTILVDEASILRTITLDRCELTVR